MWGPLPRRSPTKTTRHCRGLSADAPLPPMYRPSRFARICAAALALAALACSPSHAHGIAGNRFFPGTLNFDDPAVADEFSITAGTVQHPGDGGNVTDQGTHLMDVIQWFMNSGTPKEAECFGKVFEAKGSETPDTFSATYDYGDFITTWTLCYSNSYQNGWTILFQGDKATLILDDKGFRVFEERWPDHKDKPMIDFKGGIGAQPHVKNFLDCVKSREQPNATVEVGHCAVSGPHLANVAWHEKQRAYLNKDATKVRFKA